jgi:hypothetical protein
MAHKSVVKIRGFARLQMGERDAHGNVKIVGDSGWIKNTICADGFQNYLVGSVGAIAGSKQVSHMVLATQSTAVNSASTALVGETRIRKAVTPSFIAAGTLQLAGSWSSTDNTAAITIGSIALYNHLTTGTMASGATFTTSQWASNQDLSATYQWRLS